MPKIPFLSSTEQYSHGIAVEHPGRFSPLFVRLVRVLIWPWVRVCFRPRLDGVEHLPPQGPYLLVANHSAGMGFAEITSFMALYLRQVGPGTPMAGFALPQGFHLFPLSWIWKAAGAIPSSYEAARKTLAAGVPILMFPGGDYETLRPIYRANRVDFGGRTGFLKIAREAGVPIVPLGIRGAHYTCPIFLRSRWLAWLLVVPRVAGIKRWGLSLPGIVGALGIGWCTSIALVWRLVLIWLWLGSPLVFLPCIPWRIRMRIGRPIAPSGLFTEAEDPTLKRALATVERTIEALVNEQD